MFMNNENEKDFNQMLLNSKDMPKTVIVTDEATIKKYGGNKMFIAPPMFYDEIIKRIPKGRLITTVQLREFLAKQNQADFTDPMTCGIFTNIVAWASYQRTANVTPYWRCLKANGELNEKYPEGVTLQKKLLEDEGYQVITKGRKTIKYFVKDYEKYLVILG